jgi:Flp pilus assembly pilin Flp
MKPSIRCRRGGATLEYILVSTFAAAVSLTALGFVGKVVQAELTKMAEKLGMDAPEDRTLWE